MGSRCVRAFAALVLCTTFALHADAVKFVGILPDGFSDDVLFAGKFCFAKGKSPGLLEISAAGNSGTSFSIFDDTSDSKVPDGRSVKELSWADARKLDNCNATIASARIIDTPNGLSTGLPLPLTNMKIEVNDHAYSHFWYFVFSNCNGQISVPVYYVHAVQPNGSELSCEQLPLVPLFGFFGFVLLPLLAIHVTPQRFRSFTNKFTGPVLIALLIQFIARILMMGDLLVTSSLGYGSPGAKSSSYWLMQMAEFVLLFHAMLGSSGFHFDKSNLVNAFVAAGFLASYFFIGIAEVSVDAFEELTWNDYDAEPLTVPGIILQVLRWIIAGYCAFLLYALFKQETNTQKKEFYKQFAFVTLVWQIVYPFFTLVSLAAPPISRAATVFGLEMTSDLLYTAAMLYVCSFSRIGPLFVPSRGSTTLHQGFLQNEQLSAANSPAAGSSSAAVVSPGSSSPAELQAFTNTENATNAA